MIDRTETSMSSPIMMDWLDLRVRTSIARLPALGRLLAGAYCPARRRQPGRFASLPAFR